MKSTGIKPDQVYTTKEVESFLKVSQSTMKRWLKRGLIRANKIGRQYRILGKEIIHLISPAVEKKTISSYIKIKRKALIK